MGAYWKVCSGILHLSILFMCPNQFYLWLLTQTCLVTTRKRNINVPNIQLLGQIRAVTLVRNIMANFVDQAATVFLITVVTSVYNELIHCYFHDASLLPVLLYCHHNMPTIANQVFTCHRTHCLRWLHLQNMKDNSLAVLFSQTDALSLSRWVQLYWILTCMGAV
jgi:hypothetical protein